LDDWYKIMWRLKYHSMIYGANEVVFAELEDLITYIYAYSIREYAIRYHAKT
jgi:hypothetical protein